MKIDLEFVRRVIEMFEASGLGELELQRGDDRIRVAKPQPILTSASIAQAPSSAPAVGAPSPTAIEGEFITSPFVGTFYRAPSPTTKPFIQTGDSFAAGQALCIVEAMKLMNEIEADISGTILEVLATDGQAVEYGQRLFRIKRM